jgi:hypothetical protein
MSQYVCLVSTEKHGSDMWSEEGKKRDLFLLCVLPVTKTLTYVNIITHFMRFSGKHTSRNIHALSSTF